MRNRTILMIIFFILVAAFVALNWAELSRPTALNLGMSEVQGPLGLVMLGILGLAVILFLVYAVTLQTASLLEARNHTKELNAQRDLANKAEVSRFTELRGVIDQIENDSRTRQNELKQWFEQRMATLQQEVGSKIDNSGNTLAAYMGELEDRFDGRSTRATGPSTIDDVTPRV
ncbi:LapA family protein [Brachymonas denitrificans]|uniref:LapA family protein n=1 Tax=Brachymonas denitrificans TaxID=28220 RepID=UPI002AFEECAA|nr:LapA family protein [Brachymonas denitrificans]